MGKKQFRDFFFSLICITWVLVLMGNKLTKGRKGKNHSIFHSCCLHVRVERMVKESNYIFVDIESLFSTRVFKKKQKSQFEFFALFFFDSSYQIFSIPYVKFIYCFIILLQWLYKFGTKKIIFTDYSFDDFGLVYIKHSEGGMKRYKISLLLFNLLCYVIIERSLMLIISLSLLNSVNNSIKFIVMETWEKKVFKVVIF